VAPAAAQIDGAEAPNPVRGAVRPRARTGILLVGSVVALIVLVLH
jgi:hypothetical protein